MRANSNWTEQEQEQEQEHWQVGVVLEEEVVAERVQTQRQQLKARVRPGLEGFRSQTLSLLLSLLRLRVQNL